MSTLTISTVPIHVCRWDWCRETFETGDRLAKHVLDDHVANEVPVKREDIRLELRAFDGTSIGEDSIRTSVLMNENVSLDDEGIVTTPIEDVVFEEKESEGLAHDGDHPPSNPTHQDTVADGAEPETRIDHALSPFVTESVAPEPDTFAANHGRHSSTSSRTGSRSRGPNSFRELTASSSPSPDVDTMAIGPSPSLAELVAETINNTHNPNRVGATHRITPTRGSDNPLSSAGVGQHSRPQSAQGKRKFSNPLPSEASAPSNSGSRPPSRSLPIARSRSRTSSNASRKEAHRSSREATAPALSPIREVADISALQAGLQSDTQNSGVAISASGPFRTGLIQLIPDSSPSRTDDPSSAHVDRHTPSQTALQSEQEHPPEPGRPFDGISSYIDDITMLSSSFDASIPAFTQAFDAQNQSQWPLATQAPYSYDSSLTFNSQ